MGGGLEANFTEMSIGKDADVVVFVTGFGPFPTGSGGQYQKNASHLISQLLPHSLHVEVPDGSEATEEKGRRAVKVSILNPTAREGAYLPVEYAKIRSYLSEVYNEQSSPSTESSPSSTEKGSAKKKIDIYLHLGMADGWPFITVERVAFKQGMKCTWWSWREEDAGYYLIPDNTGKTVDDAGPNPWEALPQGLSTAFDVDALVEDAKRRNEGSSKAAGKTSLLIREHIEPGSYCCGFTYYESLANCYSRKLTPNVLFCHVPGDLDQASLERGRDAIVAIMEAAVVQFLSKTAETRLPY